MKSDAPDQGAFRDHRFFVALLVVNIVLARICMRLYGEEFVLLRHAISDLGATVTRGGYPNPRSPYLFAVEMVASGILCLRHARHLTRTADPRDYRIWLTRMAAIGFFLMPAPHDLPVTHYVHMFGGGFIFFSLWMHANLYLVEAKKSGKPGVFWIGMLVLQSTVLTYAFTFAIDWQHKQITQGIGLVGVISAVIWSSMAVARLYRPAAVRQTNGETAIPS